MTELLLILPFIGLYCGWRIAIIYYEIERGPGAISNYEESEL